MDGKSQVMLTKELSGGARIRYIFQSIFVKSLEVWRFIFSKFSIFDMLKPKGWLVLLLFSFAPFSYLKGHQFTQSTMILLLSLINVKSLSFCSFVSWRIPLLTNFHRVFVGTRPMWRSNWWWYSNGHSKCYWPEKCFICSRGEHPDDCICWFTRLAFFPLLA